MLSTNLWNALLRTSAVLNKTAVTRIKLASRTCDAPSPISSRHPSIARLGVAVL